MNQRGFVQLSIMAWGAIAAGAVILAMSAAMWVQTKRLDAEKAAFATFKGGVEALGLAAKRKAADQEAADKLKKAKADEERERLTADLAATRKRLRDARAGSSLVSAAPAGTGRPDLACYDRAELVGALRTYEGEIEGLLGEGSQAAIDLDTAKRWAQR